ncbi:hypothetical protein BJ912DRAFT_928566 [Pholiota molesta]|nr:hypothetical protein BJ912DRAFT_928566 [Pholiota molesta]
MSSFRGRPFFAERLKSFAGYSFMPTIFDALSYWLPPFLLAASRYIAIGLRKWELWSPNSPRVAFYPGVMVPDFRLGTELPEHLRRCDGHDGRFDPTVSPQILISSKLWYPFVCRQADPSSHPEFTPFLTIWDETLSAVRPDFIRKLEARVTRVMDNLETWHDFASTRPDLWAGRPLRPDSGDIVELATLSDFSAALDKNGGRLVDVTEDLWIAVSAPPSLWHDRLRSSSYGQGWRRRMGQYIAPPALPAVGFTEKNGFIIPPAVRSVGSGPGRWTHWEEDETEDGEFCFTQLGKEKGKASSGKTWYDRENRRILYFESSLRAPRFYSADISVFGLPAPAALYREVLNGGRSIQRHASVWIYKTRDPLRSDVGREHMPRTLHADPDRMDETGDGDQRLQFIGLLPQIVGRFLLHLPSPAASSMPRLARLGPSLQIGVPAEGVQSVIRGDSARLLPMDGTLAGVLRPGPPLRRPGRASVRPRGTMILVPPSAAACGRAPEVARLRLALGTVVPYPRRRRLPAVDKATLRLLPPGDVIRPRDLLGPWLVDRSRVHVRRFGVSLRHAPGLLAAAREAAAVFSPPTGMILAAEGRASGAMNMTSRSFFALFLTLSTPNA